MAPTGRHSSSSGRPAMGRSLAELLDVYLSDPPAPVVPAHDVRGVLDAALDLAVAIAPDSVVGLAFDPDGARTVVRLAGARDIARSLTLGSRLADEAAGGLAAVGADHMVLRSGDRLRLGADRGGQLDADQRALLERVALLTARSLARSGVVPLGRSSMASRPAPPAATGEGRRPDASGGSAEVA